MAIYEEAIIGRRFTLVIPKSIREEIGLKEGQRVLVLSLIHISEPTRPY